MHRSTARHRVRDRPAQPADPRRHGGQDLFTGPARPVAKLREHGRMALHAADARRPGAARGVAGAVAGERRRASGALCRNLHVFGARHAGTRFHADRRTRAAEPGLRRVPVRLPGAGRHGVRILLSLPAGGWAVHLLQVPCRERQLPGRLHRPDPPRVGRRLPGRDDQLCAGPLAPVRRGKRPNCTAAAVARDRPMTAATTLASRRAAQRVARVPSTRGIARGPGPNGATSMLADAPGSAALDRLRRLIADKAVDTVLVCMVDMQGRLAGKRMTARHFLETRHEDVHACDYLLGVDIDMQPIEGLAATSWELGFGDFAIRPDFSTMRQLPWLPGTALVLGDTVDKQGDLVPHAPRSMLK